MSLWGLVSTLSDSGKAFIASTARDIAEFKHALQDETKDIHIVQPLPAPASSTATAAAADDDDAQRDYTSAASESAASEPTGSNDSRLDASSSLLSLTSNIERMGGRVLHMLPAVFKHDNDGAALATAATAASARGTATAIARSLPSAAVSQSDRTAAAPYGTLQHDGGGSRGRSAVGEFDQRLLAAMRDQRTYVLDPEDTRTGKPPSAYESFAASFELYCVPPTHWTALLSSHPSLRHWHEQLVDTGRVDERAFWCRYEYVRQSLQQDERRRQKLADRLAGLTTAAAQQQTAGKEDELQWEEDEEDNEADEQQRRPHRRQQPLLHDSQQPSTQKSVQSHQLESDPLSPLSHSDEDQAESAPPSDSTHSLEGCAEQRPCEMDNSCPSAAVLDSGSLDSDGNDACSEGDGELLSSSPVSSEGSGELIELHDAASTAAAATTLAVADCNQLDGGGHNQHDSHAAAPTAAATTVAKAEEDDGQGSDYDDWE